MLDNLLLVRKECHSLSAPTDSGIGRRWRSPTRSAREGSAGMVPRIALICSARGRHPGCLIICQHPLPHPVHRRHWHDREQADRIGVLDTEECRAPNQSAENSSATTGLEWNWINVSTPLLPVGRASIKHAAQKAGTAPRVKTPASTIPSSRPQSVEPAPARVHRREAAIAEPKRTGRCG